MENLSNIGNRIVVGTAAEKIITNAIVDGTDSDVTNTALYPHIRSAVLRDDYICEAWRSTASDVTVNTQKKYCFGVFLSNEIEDTPRLYSCQGSFNCIINEANQFIKIYPVFGRLSNTTPVQNDAAVSNLLDMYFPLPEEGIHQVGVNSATAGTIVKSNVKAEVVIRDSSVTDLEPVFFGFVIENWGAADCNIDCITAMVSLRTNVPHQIATFAGV